MTTVTPNPGDWLEDYQIIEKIGGNMCCVFKARHRLLNKIVALKLLPPEFTTDPKRLARFKNELLVVGKLKYPNLVTATDARVVDGWHFLVMEWIDGMDLQRLIQLKDLLSVADACECVRQAALGLQYVHEHKLIHRDVKPSNLMLERTTGIIKVIDLGLALIKDEATAQLTQTGFVLGTMRYCPPEQLQNSHVDRRADIYSLNCTLYHLIAGKPPYWERTTIPEVLEAHRSEPFPGLAQVCPEAPPSLDQVLARMTAKKPADRFESAAQVAEVLKPFTQGADPKHLLPPPSKPPEIDPSLPPRGSHNGPRRKWVWKRMAAAGAVLLAVAGILLLALNRPQPKSGMPAGVTNAAPVVVLMDTTAKHGVYDEENKEKKGFTNAEELEKVLRRLPLGPIHKEAISLNWIYSDWVGEARVLGWDPDLVIIHRSAFFHPLNAELDFGYPPFTNNPAQEAKWEKLYRVTDTVLIGFLGTIAASSPHTKFLVYSRGTDTNWLNQTYRDKWIREAGDRIPALKGRLETILIPTNAPTFKAEETAELMRGRTRSMLGLP